MPSRTWIVTRCSKCGRRVPTGVSMPSRAWIVTQRTIIMNQEQICFNALTGLNCYFSIFVITMELMLFQCPHGLELLRTENGILILIDAFQCPHGLELLLVEIKSTCRQAMFQCPHGLELLRNRWHSCIRSRAVSMPSRAWIVTARMPNILNFSWYFLCIPAIYRYILAHLPIFFNQLSKFLRCESPSTFLGTCLSHHSFIWW